ncbi:hypothetical protein ACK32U_00220 [Aeromonas dhakensis]|uniref:hypothetical protein n=1 Tax=Aeromonas dhakensis TaxID=196024 RepID=UPI003989E5C6
MTVLYWQVVTTFNTPLLIELFDSASFEAGMKELSLTLLAWFFGQVMVLSFLVTDFVADGPFVHQMSLSATGERGGGEAAGI